MALAQTPLAGRSRATEEDLLRMPDGKYELVDGEIRSVPASFIHDIIGTRLVARLAPLTEHIGYLAGAQAGFRMPNRNVRCPDLSLTLYERIEGDQPEAGFGDFAPDLCIEIISPSEDRKDMQRKVEEYFAGGARIVWQLFPESKSVRVFTSPTASTLLEPDAELHGGDVIPGFRCQVSELFDVSKR